MAYKLLNRREFLGTAAAAWTAIAGCATPRPLPKLGEVMTVRGPIAPGELGVTLPHEHVLVDFAPADEVGRHRYDPLEVVETALPYLTEIKQLGVDTLVDATPAYLGRDPRVLVALSERSGLHILTNTGYYGAREDQHLPEHAFTESAEELADRWIAEWKYGIDDSGIRPGIMKIGVDAQPLSDQDAKLVEAAAITHLETGLTIASHTGPAQPALEQIDLIRDLGVHPSAWIWVHAHAEPDLDHHVEAARRGAWVSFDGVSPDTVTRHVNLVVNMRRHRLLHRVLLSHDAGWYSVGEPGGGDFRGFSTLFTDLIPALRKEGLTDEEVVQLVRVNPAEALRIRVRRLQA